MASLYVHIPFCVRKCAYCDFDSEPVTGASIPAFLKSLRKEIRLRAERWILPDPMETLYFGGGTPSLLSANQIDILLHFLRESFSMAEDAEISLEANPGTLTPHKLEGYLQSGVNRLSLGIQSFRDDELALLGRIHHASDGIDAFDLARQAGFHNMGVDLIFGLPGQSLEAWKESLFMALGLEPEHISAYILTWDNETPLGRAIREGRFLAPDEDRVAEMYLWTSEVLRSAGYEHYEVSNFARKGYRCRHNEGYWTGKPYLGLGPSAHSFFHGKRSWNVRSLRAYMDRIAEGLLPVAGEESLTPTQRRLEEKMLLLRRSEGLPLKALPRDTKRLEPLFRQGLAAIRGRRFVLTPKGFLLADEIAARLGEESIPPP